MHILYARVLINKILFTYMRVRVTLHIMTIYLYAHNTGRPIRARRTVVNITQRNGR